MEEQLLQGMESSMQTTSEMTVDQFKNTLADRLDSLTDEEKVSLLDMYGTEEFKLIGKLLGPEITGTVSKKLNAMAKDAVLNPEGVQPSQTEMSMEEQTNTLMTQPDSIV